MLLAEFKKDLRYVVKSNALKRKCDESNKNLELLEEQYSVLAEKKKKRVCEYQILYICITYYLQS